MVVGEACSVGGPRAYEYWMEEEAEGWYQTGAAGEACSSLHDHGWRHQALVAGYPDGAPCLILHPQV